LSTRIEQLPGEPILLLTIQGHLDAHIMQHIYAQMAELSRNVEGSIYRIIDVRDMDVTLGDMVEIIKSTIPGIISHPRYTNVFVGKSSTSRYAIDVLRLRCFGGGATVMLSSLDDALNYARQKAGVAMSAAQDSGTL
jgi:hypothetical protein